MKKKMAVVLLCGVLLLTSAVFAQETEIVRPTAVPNDTIQIKNPYLNQVQGTDVLNQVKGTDIISGMGNNTITLWDRSKYVNQPKSVVLPNAREVFADSMEVPKPSLDRPITDPWDDLKSGYACEAVLNSPYYFQQMKFGEEFTLDMTFINTGTQTWDFNIDVMMYTGDQLQKDPDRYVWDLWETADPHSYNSNSHIVKPGESIRLKIPMRAPTSRYHDDNKYYAAYTLVRNWNLYGMDMLHDGRWDLTGEHAMFCPVYFYIYVP